MRSWRAYAAVFLCITLLLFVAYVRQRTRTDVSQKQDVNRTDPGAFFRTAYEALTGTPAPPSTDRCTVCHVGIQDARLDAIVTRPREGGREVAFRNAALDRVAQGHLGPSVILALMAHPRRDILAAHPKVSCEQCHSTEDRRAEEGLTAIQREKWAKGYMMEHVFTREPMMPAHALQAACARCHGASRPLPGAERFNESLLYFERGACYACHVTPGMVIRAEDLAPGGDAALLRRPAPPLTPIASKVDKPWAYNWILNPLTFKPTARMPPFFPRGPVGWPRALAEKHPAGENGDETLWERVVAACLAEYVFSISSTLDVPPIPDDLLPDDPEARAPRVRRGWLQVVNIGCLACHMTDETNYPRGFHYAGYTYSTSEFATNLVGTGDKFDTPQGRRWLFHWLKNPKHLFPETQMPEFGLTDEEAADIASYLLTLKVDNTLREKAGQPLWKPHEAPIRVEGDEVVVEPEAQKIFDALWERLKPGSDTLSLKEKVLAYGERTFEFFGCYACHEASDARRGERDWQRMPLPDKPTWELSPERGVMQRMPLIPYNSTEQEWAVLYVRAVYEAHRARSEKPWSRVDAGEALVRRQNCAGCHVRSESRFLVDGTTWCEGQLKASDEARHYVAWVVDPETLDLNAIQKGNPIWIDRNRVHQVLPPEGGTMATRFLRLYSSRSAQERERFLELMPPSLRMPGTKFTREWLTSFLTQSERLRPKLERYVRMPRFGWTETDRDAVIEYFRAKRAEPPPKMPKAWGSIDASVREVCLPCHTLDGRGKADAQELGTLGRLRRDWLAAFLKQPSHVIPRTAMPAVREELVNDREFFEGLVDYLLAYEDVRREKIRDGDAQTRAQAVRFVHHREDVRLAVEKCLSEKEGALAILESVRDRSLTEELVPLLHAESAEVRQRAIEVLAERGVGWKVIATSLEDDAVDVRLIAMRTLVSLGAREAGALVARRLKDKESMVRLAALEALARLRARSEAGEIAQLLVDPSENVRRLAVDVLVRLGAAEQAPALAKALADPEVQVRKSALEALALFRAKGEAQAVSVLLRDAHASVRAAAVTALAEMEARERVDEVRRGLDDEDPPVRWAVAVYLARIGHEEAPSVFERLLNEKPIQWLTQQVLREGANELNVLGRRDLYERLRVLEVGGGERSVKDWIALVADRAGMTVEMDGGVEALLGGTCAVPERSTGSQVLNATTRAHRICFLFEEKKLKVVPLSRALWAWER